MLIGYCDWTHSLRSFNTAGPIRVEDHDHIFSQLVWCAGERDSRRAGLQNWTVIWQTRA